MYNFSLYYYYAKYISDAYYKRPQFLVKRIMINYAINAKRVGA